MATEWNIVLCIQGSLEPAKAHYSIYLASLHIEAKLGAFDLENEHMYDILQMVRY